MTPDDWLIAYLEKAGEPVDRHTVIGAAEADGVQFGALVMATFDLRERHIWQQTMKGNKTFWSLQPKKKWVPA